MTSINLPLPVNENDHSIGPVDAVVTVVNYGDYQCPDCQRQHREVERMFDELFNRVRFVYRHFPLIRSHPQALKAAEAAEAAAAQSKFWEMHRRLYTHSNKLEDHHLRKYARESGLDLNRFDQEMADDVYKEQVLKSYRESLVHGITGTPTTYINDKLYAMSGTELITAVKALL
ncbi:MAG TPA: thioredoxin domain-containing protein [Pyrinomonadaceae bacterium]